MADVRDRQQPVQVVNTQHHHHRFDQGTGHGTGSNYKQSSTGGPSTSEILAVLALLPVGGTLLALAGLTLAGTVIGLLVATPVFIIFSPVLIPAILTVLLAVTGFLSSGAFGLTGLSSFSYAFNRWGMLRSTGTGTQQEQDQFKRRAQHTMQDMAEYVGQKTKETGQKIENKAQQGKGQGQGQGQGQGEGQVHETRT